MSYDLHLEIGGSDDLREADVADVEAQVRRLRRGISDIVASSGEGGHRVSLKMPGADADAAKSYAALVELASRHGWRLYDPQAGTHVTLDAPGRYPPGWVPTRPISGKSTAARIKQLVTEDLRADGFVSRGTRTALRPRDGFDEKLELVVSRGRVTVDVCWFFPSPLAEPYELHGTRRLGHLVGGEDTWYPDDAKGFGAMRRDLREHALPWFARFATLHAIADGVERGEIELAADPGWTCYRMAHIYQAIGRAEEALTQLETLLREHSKNAYRLQLETLTARGAPSAHLESTKKRLAEYEGSPDDWVYRREQAVRREVAALRS